MYEVFIWVPTRGWKQVAEHRDRTEAAKLALEFTPLEVRLSAPDGRNWNSGRMHTFSPEDQGLNQIEELIEKGS